MPDASWDILFEGVYQLENNQGVYTIPKMYTCWGFNLKVGY